MKCPWINQWSEINCLTIKEGCLRRQESIHRPRLRSGQVVRNRQCKLCRGILDRVNLTDRQTTHLATRNQKGCSLTKSMVQAQLLRGPGPSNQVNEQVQMLLWKKHPILPPSLRNYSTLDALWNHPTKHDSRIDLVISDFCTSLKRRMQ